MLELNEQELEQVAGGHGGFGSTSSSVGYADAYLGAAASSSYAASTVTPWYATSAASNTSGAIGFGVDAASTATTSAGAHH